MLVFALLKLELCSTMRIFQIKFFGCCWCSCGLCTQTMSFQINSLQKVSALIITPDCQLFQPCQKVKVLNILIKTGAFLVIVVMVLSVSSVKKIRTSFSYDVILFNFSKMFRMLFLSTAGCANYVLNLAKCFDLMKILHNLRMLRMNTLIVQFTSVSSFAHVEYCWP